MISTQYIKLNMTPSGALPVLYCSQYDVGRPLGLVVHNGSEPVDLDTYTVTIEATRTDRTPITAAVTTDDNIGVFVTTAEMTNKEDKYFAKLALFDTNSRRVASLAFVMVITPATMDENAESIQEDRSLYEQYTAAVQVLIAEIREDIADLNSQTHDTVADMKADTNLKTGMYVRTGGYYAVNDGGGALYRIKSTAPSAYYEMLSNGLYAELICEGCVTPEMFGAYGDGSHDDTTAVQETLNYGNVTVLFTKKYVSGAISILSNNTLIFKDGAELIQKGGSGVTSYVFIEVRNSTNVVIDGATITGNYGNYSAGSFDEYADLLKIDHGSHSIRVTNCIFKNSVGDGLEICSNSLVATDIPYDVTIENCQFENIGCCDFAITGGKNIVFRNGILSGGKRIAPKCAIDMEPNAANVGNENILISGVVHNGDTNGIYVNVFNKNVTLENVVTNQIVAIGKSQNVFISDKAENIAIKNCNVGMFAAFNADNCLFVNNKINGYCFIQCCKNTRFANNDISNDRNYTLVLGDLIDCIIDRNFIHGTPSSYAIECSNGGLRQQYDIDKYYYIVSNNIIVNNTPYAIDTDRGVLFINNVFTNVKLNGYYLANDRSDRTTRIIDTINTNIRVTDLNLINTYLKRGDVLIASRPTSVGNFMYYCKTAGYHAWKSWEASTSVLSIDSITVNGYVYVCIREGTTGATQPIFSTDVNSITIDGTAEWKCVGVAAEIGTVKFEQ